MSFTNNPTLRKNTVLDMMSRIISLSSFVPVKRNDANAELKRITAGRITSAEMFFLNLPPRRKIDE